MARTCLVLVPIPQENQERVFGPLTIAKILVSESTQMENGVLRLVGWSHNASIPNYEKYPMLLPAKHRLIDLVLTGEQQKTLHAGPGVLGILVLVRPPEVLGGCNLVR